MTRASLLHIFNHVGSISEAEVRELEQLAAAFPYCQTAHLLLAKAAHDQGSMLASQRLRRAATYAVDRQLLRQLLEQPAAVVSTLEVAVPKELAVAEEVATAAPTAGSSTAFFQALIPEDVQPIDIQEDNVTNAEEVSVETNPVVAPAPDNTVAIAVADEEPTNSGQVTPDSSEQVATSELLSEPSDAPTILVVGASPAEVADVALESSETPTEKVDTLLSEASDPTPTIAETEELLPAAAPPIRPPADAGISRFEFGLNEPEDQIVPILYQLPGLNNEDDEEAVQPDLSSGSAITTALAPPFRSDITLAYSLLPEGSRFGYALQLQDEELTQPLPTTEFFPPDALLHEHASRPQLPAAPTPSSLDLINRFLKVQPRLKSPVVLPTAQEQTDLSARSTSAPPALASESLAKILVKQGKKDRAIEIYEQLIVRQPEKSAYFADQILHLKTPE